MSHREQLLGESQQRPAGSEDKLWHCMDIQNFHHICPSAKGIQRKKEGEEVTENTKMLQTHCQWMEAPVGQSHKAE